MAGSHKTARLAADAVTEIEGKLKILYHHRIGSKDGQAVHVESLIAALRRCGHEIQVIAPPSFQKLEFGAQASWLARIRRRLPRPVCELLEICYNVPALWRLSRS